MTSAQPEHRTGEDGEAGDLRPMLPVALADPFDHPDWVFEVRWDGIRVIATVVDGEVTLRTRRQQDITAYFPEIQASLARSVERNRVVLDGTLVAVDDEQTPRFTRVIERLRGGNAGTVTLEAYDLLSVGGRLLIHEPLWRRKTMLHDALVPNNTIHVTHFEEADGAALFEAASDLGLGGIVAKKKSSGYRPGVRHDDWVKVKSARTANLIVGGYTFGGGPKDQLFGSMLLGALDGDRLFHVATVGGGFTQQEHERIYEALSGAHASGPPFINPPAVDRFLYWCAPQVVVRVEYGEIGASGQLRFPVFDAVRPDIPPGDCSLDALGTAEAVV